MPLKNFGLPSENSKFAGSKGNLWLENLMWMHLNFYRQNMQMRRLVYGILLVAVGIVVPHSGLVNTLFFMYPVLQHGKWRFLQIKHIEIDYLLVISLCMHLESYWVFARFLRIAPLFAQHHFTYLPQHGWITITEHYDCCLGFQDDICPEHHFIYFHLNRSFLWYDSDIAPCHGVSLWSHNHNDILFLVIELKSNSCFITPFKSNTSLLD